MKYENATNEHWNDKENEANKHPIRSEMLEEEGKTEEKKIELKPNQRPKNITLTK